MGANGLKRRIFTPLGILTVGTVAALVGSTAHAVIVLAGKPGNVLYFSLQIILVVDGLVSIYILRRSYPVLALEAYAWTGGAAFGAMVVYDATRGKAWEPAFCALYFFGIASLVIFATPRQAKAFTAAVSVLALIAGLANGFSTGFFLALAAWGAFAVISWLVEQICELRTDKDTIAGGVNELLGAWRENDERPCGDLASTKSNT